MADIKQYVNLDPAQASQLGGDIVAARAGNKVVLEATIDPKESGVAVIFEITNGEANIKNPGAVKKKIATTDGDGKASLDYELSKFGGDEFTVKAYVNAEDDPLVSDKYIVWRRFYCQVARFQAKTFDNPDDPDLDVTLPAVSPVNFQPIKTEFEGRNHNIEIVVAGGVQDIERYKEIVDKAAREVSAKDGYDASQVPVVARVVMVPMIADSKTASLRFEVNRGAFVQRDLPHLLWRDPSLLGNAEWLDAAEWRSKDGGPWTAMGDIVNLNRRQISVSVPGEGRAEVRVRYRYVANSTLGITRYNAIWIAASGPMGSFTEARKQETIVHEIGHFCDMVPFGQMTRYTGRGHQGPHCSQGLSPLWPSYKGKKGTCVMFGEDSSAAGIQFCADCDVSLRKRKVQKQGMPAGPW